MMLVGLYLFVVVLECVLMDSEASCFQQENKTQCMYITREQKDVRDLASQIVP